MAQKARTLGVLFVLHQKKCMTFFYITSACTQSQDSRTMTMLMLTMMMMMSRVMKTAKTDN